MRCIALALLVYTLPLALPFVPHPNTVRLTYLAHASRGRLFERKRGTEVSTVAHYACLEVSSMSM